MRNFAPLLLVVTGCITEPSMFVEKTGDGDGRVVSDPADIDCGETCGALVSGPMTLAATPDEQSVFVGWEGGGCSGTEPCTLDVADDTSIQATFALAPPMSQLDVRHQGIGFGRVTSDPAGINCDRSGYECTARFETGSTVRLTAVANAGFTFSGWQGCPLIEAVSVCVVELTAPLSVAATFTDP